MIKLIVTIAAVLLTYSHVFAGFGYQVIGAVGVVAEDPPGDECEGLLVCQNFENASGYDNDETWTTSGTVNPNYTTTTLRGDYSCSIDTTGYIFSPEFGPSAEITAHFLWYKSGNPGSTQYLLRAISSSGTNTALEVNSSGQVILTIAGAGSQTSDALANGVYRIWVTENSASPAPAAVYIVGPTTLPTLPSTTRPGTATLSTQRGSAIPNSSANVRFYVGGSSSIIDQCLIDDSLTFSEVAE